MKKLLKVGLSLALALSMLMGITSCGSATYDYPDGAPYAGIPELPGINGYSCEHTHIGDTDTFKVTFTWKPENLVEASFTDDFYLEFTDGLFAYELQEPDKTPASTGKVTTIKPGDKVTILFDYDGRFTYIPSGYYRFVVVFKAVDNEGKEAEYLGHFEFDLSADDDF